MLPSKKSFLLWGLAEKNRKYIVFIPRQRESILVDTHTLSIIIESYTTTYCVCVCIGGFSCRGSYHVIAERVIACLRGVLTISLGNHSLITVIETLPHQMFFLYFDRVSNQLLNQSTLNQDSFDFITSIFFKLFDKLHQIRINTINFFL